MWWVVVVVVVMVIVMVVVCVEGDPLCWLSASQAATGGLRCSVDRVP